ncbi:MAG TPA: hypothetical protein VN706_02575 [Gemmatimonadaceae bacterium]|nr:hypothetical protein [Gemmatimonadaceae bacterium]
MPAKTDPRQTSAAPTYFYRRALDARDLLPAIGVGVAMGLAAFYLTKLYLERAPLTPEGLEPRRRSKRAKHAMHLRRARAT